MSWTPSAEPSRARSILPIEPQNGDRIGVWFGPLDAVERMALDALRWYAVREGCAFYVHRDSADITTAIVRPKPKPLQSQPWTPQADGDE